MKSRKFLNKKKRNFTNKKWKHKKRGGNETEPNNNAIVETPIDKSKQEEKLENAPPTTDKTNVNVETPIDKSKQEENSEKGTPTTDNLESEQKLGLNSGSQQNTVTTVATSENSTQEPSPDTQPKSDDSTSANPNDDVTKSQIMMLEEVKKYAEETKKAATEIQTIYDKFIESKVVAKSGGNTKKLRKIMLK
jgi:hypothetical protein